MLVVFQNEAKLKFKDWIPKDLTFGVAYNSQCGIYNECYGCECDTFEFTNRWTYWYIPLTKKNVKPRNNTDSTLGHHLLLFNHLASFDDFYKNGKKKKKKKKERKRDQLSLNRCLDTILPIWQDLIIIPLLEFYFVWIVAKLFLLNEVFILLSSISVCRLLLVIIILSIFLCLWLDETEDCFCHECLFLLFFIINTYKWTEKTRPKSLWKKYGLMKLFAILLLLLLLLV